MSPMAGEILKPWPEKPASRTMSAAARQGADQRPGAVGVALHEDGQAHRIGVQAGQVAPHRRGEGLQFLRCDGPVQAVRVVHGLVVGLGQAELDGQAVRGRDAVEGDVAAADEGGTLRVRRVVLVGGRNQALIAR